MQIHKTHINKNLVSLFSILFLLLFGFSAFGQNKKQLQQKRKKLQREIRQINKLLSKNKKDEKTLLTRLGEINKKIEVRQELINTINKESETYTKEITENTKEIEQLTNQLETLKTEYAKIVVQTYKNKNKHSDLLFILSSNSFTQAYKRSLYMKQYADYRKEQANKIKEKRILLKQYNDSLLLKKQVKDSLIIKKLEETKSVDQAKETQQQLLEKVKSKEKQYIAKIKKKQQQERNFEKQLFNVITKSRTKKSKKKGSKKSIVKLTPEAKKLANSFIANKGRLPHPVTKGYISRYFGQRSHEQLKKIKIKSNGWHYITEKNAKARAIYKGDVIAIIVDKKTKLKTVLLQHGNYYTAYKNLDKIFVKKGDKVKIKQDLGIIHTDSTTGKTKLIFALMKDTIPQNPTYWLKK